MKILFLDFDGVLHPAGAGGKRFTQLPLLEACLREPEVQDVQLVISSTWRQAYSLPTLRKFFSADIAGRILGSTPALEDFRTEFERGEEIKAWLAANKSVRLWCALDDDEEGFSLRLRSRLILTNKLTGITQKDVVELKKMLLRAQ